MPPVGKMEPRRSVAADWDSGMRARQTDGFVIQKVSEATTTSFHTQY